MKDFAAWFRTSKAAESMPAQAVDAWVKLVIPYIHSTYLMSIRFNNSQFNAMLKRLQVEDDVTVPGMYMRMQITAAKRIAAMRSRTDPWQGM